MQFGDISAFYTVTEKLLRQLAEREGELCA